MSPSEIVVQHLPQYIVVAYSDVGQSLVEAGDGTTIHFLVFPVPAVHPDDSSFVAIGIGIRDRVTECFGPSESFDMLRMEAMAERMGNDIIGHHPLCHA